MPEPESHQSSLAGTQTYQWSHAGTRNLPVVPCWNPNLSMVPCRNPKPTSGPSAFPAIFVFSFLSVNSLQEYSSWPSYTAGQYFLSSGSRILKILSPGVRARTNEFSCCTSYHMLLPAVSCWNPQKLQVTVSLRPGRGRMVPHKGQKDGSVLNGIEVSIAS